jgi:hypothetical protein
MGSAADITSGPRGKLESAMQGEAGETYRRFDRNVSPWTT